MIRNRYNYPKIFRSKTPQGKKEWHHNQNTTSRKLKGHFFFKKKKEWRGVGGGEGVEERVRGRHKKGGGVANGYPKQKFHQDIHAKTYSDRYSKIKVKKGILPLETKNTQIHENRRIGLIVSLHMQHCNLRGCIRPHRSAGLSGIRFSNHSRNTALKRLVKRLRGT